MEFYPAVDIHGGSAVRLFKGEYGRVTEFGNPVELALKYVELGARRLHVIDLDGARSGKPVNSELVFEIVRKSGVPVQVGGGIRTAEDVENMLAGGVSRVILGTTALVDRDALVGIAHDHPGSVVVSLDYKGGAAKGGAVSHEPGHGDSIHEPGHGDSASIGDSDLSISGWEKQAGIGLLEAIEICAALPLAALVVTAIDRDGTMQGPDIDGLYNILYISPHPIIVAGGVRNLEDLKALKSISKEGRRVEGVISGRAVAEGALPLPEALEVCGDLRVSDVHAVDMQVLDVRGSGT